MDQSSLPLMNSQTAGQTPKDRSEEQIQDPTFLKNNITGDTDSGYYQSLHNVGIS